MENDDRTEEESSNEEKSQAVSPRKNNIYSLKEWVEKQEKEKEDKERERLIQKILDRVKHLR